MSASIADKIAQVHVLELQKRKTIHRVMDGPTLDVVYRFDDRLRLH
jgi:hypothetical protein